MSTQSKDFSEFKLNRQLLNAVEEMGLKEPTEIQLKCIPRIYGGQDLIGIAPTGTGKTLAYLLPILMTLKYAQGNDPRGLILVPTRELGMQVDQVCRKLCTYLDLRMVCLYGGVGPKSQIEEIRKGADLIIATPGRLLEIYLKGHLALKFIKHFVIDEADKMMDMGFMPQIRKVLEVIPAKRQNLLFSATMHEKVDRLVAEFIEDPATIEVSPSATVVETIDLEAYEAPNFLTKINLLAWLLRNEPYEKVLVFVRKRVDAENIYKFIHRKIEPSVRAIHANKGQNTRINSMKSFSEDEVKILVATDVVSRGIDIRKVGLVINFDMPMVLEDFVHRVGRTGRAKETGKAITLISPEDRRRFEQANKLIYKKIPLMVFPDSVEIVETEKTERIRQERDIDTQKRKLDPTFKGAFHDKKNAAKGRKGAFKRRKPGKRG